MMGETCGSLNRGRRSERGYVLLATGLALFAVMGMTGLAVDLGRMYIAKNETQSYADAAAISAALQLDGTAAGFQRARDTVAASANRWNFGNTSFSGTLVEFSQNETGPWEPNPMAASDYLFVRVSADASVPMTFMQTLAQGGTRPVRALAAAGQVLKTGTPEGIFPFSPFAHSEEEPDFGLLPGSLYTLRWGASPRLNNANSICAGDAVQDIIDLAKAGGGEERGYIEETSASIIRESIVSDYQTVFREIGDSVNMAGGAKQTQRDALTERVRQDSDRQSTTFYEYRAKQIAEAADAGNGRRLIVAPINTGALGTQPYEIVQFGLFFLQTDDEYLEAMGGNKPFCAEYVGAGGLQGGDGPGAGGPGFYVVRLVQ